MYGTPHCLFKGTVSQELRLVRIAIYQSKAFSSAHVIHHKIYILLKGHFTKEDPSYVCRAQKFATILDGANIICWRIPYQGTS